MNASTNLCWIFLIGHCWLQTAVAEAGVFPEDPLRTTPAMIAQGPYLPGDAAALSCPHPVDWTQPLSLSDTVDLALCNDPQVRQAWANIKLQASAVGQARSAYLPTLSGSMSRLRTSNRYPDFPGSDSSSTGQTAYLSFNWRLFDFGGRAANMEAANRSLAAAMLSHDAALQKTLSAAVTAYFDAQTAAAMVQARQEAMQVALRTLSVSETRMRKGEAAQSDVLQARTAVAKAQLAAQRATGNYENALGVLRYTMNQPVAQSILLAPISEGHATEATGELTQWISTAQLHHPGILAARAQMEAAQARIQSVRAEGLPKLDFTSSYYRNGYPNQGLQSTRSSTTTLGITLTIPLFDGYSQHYKIREAQALAEQSEAQYADAERQILLNVVKAHADAVSSLHNLESSDHLLTVATAALISSEKRYQKGVAEIIELLSQQNALAEAQEERIRCLAEWRSARLRLLANTGMLGSDDIKTVQ